MPNEIQTEGSLGNVNIDAGSDTPLGSEGNTDTGNTDTGNTDTGNELYF